MPNIHVCTFGKNHPDQPELTEALISAIKADRRAKLGELQNLFAVIDPESKLRPLIDSILLDNSDLVC